MRHNEIQDSRVCRLLVILMAIFMCSMRKVVFFIWSRELENLVDPMSWLLLSTTFIALLIDSPSRSQGILLSVLVLDSIFVALVLLLWINALAFETNPNEANTTDSDRL